MAIDLRDSVNSPAMQADQFYNELRNVRRTIEVWRNALSAGPVIIDRVIEPIKQLKFFRERWQAYLTVANRNYIATDLAFDVTTDFVTIRNAIDGIIAWSVTNIPRDASGNIQERTLVDGVETKATLTTVQTAPVVAFMDTIIATVLIT